MKCDYCHHECVEKTMMQQDKYIGCKYWSCLDCGHEWLSAEQEVEMDKIRLVSLSNEEKDRLV